MGRMLKVLYAEDDDRDADLTQQHFKLHAKDIDLKVVPTAAECLRELSDDGYDLLLLDNHLPDAKAVDVLKSLLHIGTHMPVVVVTGAGDEELAVRALHLGAADYISKLGDYIQGLPKLVRRVVQEQYQRDDTRPEHAVNERQILYIERNLMDVDLARAHFAREAPHLRLEVYDRCLAALTELDGARRFDAVITDLRVPDMNALDFLREIRQRGIEVPVVVITGRGDEETAVAALKLGAYDYIVKRDNYLTQLPYAIDHAIARHQLDVINTRLSDELARINQSLETKVAERTRALDIQIRERERAEREVRELNEDLERRVQARTAELEAANRQLESFSYSVSHDLRAPLRIIANYAEILQSDYAPSLPQDAQDMLRSMRQQSHHLSALIEDLLMFCRVGQQELRKVPVSLAELVRAVVGEVRDFEGVNPLTVVVADGLPTVHGDYQLLRQALMNLIANAFKYSRNAESPQITIRHEGNDGEDTICIRDNGTGFDSTYAEKLFKPFGRLHRLAEYEGTGIGLAIVHNVIARHGGRVWAEGAVGQGATFCFSLPKAPRA